MSPNSSQRRALCALVMCALIQHAFAIGCYVCNSKADDNCGEVVDGDRLIESNKVESGCTACVKKFAAQGTALSFVHRSCSKTKSKDECMKFIGNGMCYCTTTFCNNNNAISASGLMISLMVALCLFCI